MSAHMTVSVIANLYALLSDLENLLGETKICYLHIQTCVKQEVFRFEIPCMCKISVCMYVDVCADV